MLIKLCSHLLVSKNYYNDDCLTDLFSQYIVGLSATQKLFRHMTSHWWNELPDDIATSTTFLSTTYNYILSRYG